MSSTYYRSHIRSEEWKEKRQQVIRHSGSRCQKCGDRTSWLHVHHKHYRTLGREELP